MINKNTIDNDCIENQNTKRYELEMNDQLKHKLVEIFDTTRFIWNNLLDIKGQDDCDFKMNYLLEQLYQEDYIRRYFDANILLYIKTKVLNCSCNKFLRKKNKFQFAFIHKFDIGLIGDEIIKVVKDNDRYYYCGIK